MHVRPRKKSQDSGIVRFKITQKNVMSELISLFYEKKMKETKKCSKELLI